MPKKTEPSEASKALMASAQSQQDAIMQGIENFQLPKALVMRIAKSEVRGRNAASLVKKCE